MKQTSRESRLSRLAWLTKFLSTLVILMCSANNIHAQLGGQAVVTSFSGDASKTVLDGPVVRIIDIHNPPNTGSNYVAPQSLINWRASEIGQVFGVAVNKANEIFVSASSVHENYHYSDSPFAFGPAGSGGVYKLDPVTNAFVALTNTVPFNSPNVMGTNSLPNGSAGIPGVGLGNICYDKVHDKLFVSNFEDGKIYRIDPITGNVDDIYDPVASANPGGTSNPAMLLDDGIEGHTPWGDRVFGLAYNAVENRLYYGVCVKSIWDKTADKYNSIRSIGLNNSGEMTGTDVFEIAINNYYTRNGQASSGVISDITFNYPTGGAVQMAVAGKAVNSIMKSVAHASGAHLYEGSSGSWGLSTTYVVGDDSNFHNTLTGISCSGGIDFGYLSYDASTQINSGEGKRVWFTSDAMIYDPNFGGWLYGIHSSPTAGNGGGPQGSFKNVGHFIDLDETAPVVSSTPSAAYGTEDKSQIGDVEIFESIIACSLNSDAGEDQYICEGETVTLGGSYPASGGTTPYTYSWYNEQAELISNQPNPTESPEETTTYYLRVSDDEDCESYDQITIYVIEGPTDQVICDGESVNVFDPPPSESNLTVVNPASGQVYTVATGFNVSPSSTTTYDWTIIIEGVTCSGEVTVTVKPSPTADAGEYALTGDGRLCAGSEIILGGEPTASGGTPGYTYDWTANPNPRPVRYDTSNPKAYPEVSTLYRVLVTDTNGCTATDSIFVAVNPRPIAEAGDSRTICKGDTTTIGTPVGLALHNYSWSVVPSSTPTPPNVSGPDVHPDVTSTYTLTVRNSNGCTSTDDVTVRVSEIIVDAGKNRAICTGEFTELGGEPTAEGGTVPYFFDWNLAPDIENPIVQPSATTKYIVKVNDLNNCKGIDSVVVTVGSFPVVDAGYDRTICSGVETELGGDTTVHGSGTYVVTWYALPETLPFSTLDNPTVTPDTTTTYVVVATNSVAGCSSSDTVTVKVKTTPEITMSDDVEICLGQSTQLSLSATGTGNTYQWSPSSTLDCDDCESPVAIPAETTEYCVHVTSNNGCIPDNSNNCVTVTVNPLPVADAGPDMTICEGKLISLGGIPTATGGTPFFAIPNPYYNYSWTDGSNNVISTESNPVITTGPTNNYTVTVTDSKGCTDIDDVDIITFPNIEHVFNPGFETGNLPIARGQLTLANTDNTWFPSSGDPDLFDDDYIGCLPSLNSPDCTLDPVDINCVGIPCNHFGYQEHRYNASGENGRYAGLFSLVTTTGDNEFGQVNNLTVDDLHYSMEGMEQELDIALVKGEFYCIDFWASLAENGELTEYTNHDEAWFRVKLSNGAKYGGNTVVNGIPVPLYMPAEASVLYSGKITDMNNWENFSHEFQADRAYSHLIIESWFPESILDKVVELSGNTTQVGVMEFLGLQSYFYIDDVTLNSSGCCGVVALKTLQSANNKQNTIVIPQTKLNLFPNPTSGELNIQLNTDSEEAAYVQVYSLDAKLVSQKQAVNVTNNGVTTINLSHLPQGIYYVELVQGEQVIRERIVVQ